MGPHTSPTVPVALACALVLSVSCSSKTDSTTSGDGGVASVDANVDAAAAADADDSCSQGCSGNASAGSLCVVSADAQLVDTTSAPVAGEVLLLCGTNLCSLPVMTDAQGKAHFSLCLNMTSPALKYLGNASYVSFGVAMTQPTETFPPIMLVPLPEQGAAFPSGQGAVVSGSVTLGLANGTPTFDPTEPSDPNSLEFRAGPMTPAEAPPGLDASFGVKALWGLAPLNAALDPPGALTIPNPDPTGWAAGTKVDFVMNGLDENANAPAPYGGWGAVSTGTVSQDGQTITTDADAGLPILGLVGVGPHM